VIIVSSLIIFLSPVKQLYRVNFSAAIVIIIFGL
jgi:hypothetical protein